MFTSTTARVSTNTYCLARTRRFSRRSENSVGRVTHESEAPTGTVQLGKSRHSSYRNTTVGSTTDSSNVGGSIDGCGRWFYMLDCHRERILAAIHVLE